MTVTTWNDNAEFKDMHAALLMLRCSDGLFLIIGELLARAHGWCV